MDQGPLIVRRRVEIGHLLGLHLRVAERFVRSANAFRSEVRVHHNEVMADGRSILGLLGLAAGCGTTIDIVARGPDAESAVEALAGLVSAGLPEPEDRGRVAES